MDKNLYNTNTGAKLNPNESYVNAQGQTITQGSNVISSTSLAPVANPIDLASTIPPPTTPVIPPQPATIPDAPIQTQNDTLTNQLMEGLGMTAGKSAELLNVNNDPNVVANNTEANRLADLYQTTAASYDQSIQGLESRPRGAGNTDIRSGIVFGQQAEGQRQKAAALGVINADYLVATKQYDRAKKQLEDNINLKYAPQEERNTILGNQLLAIKDSVTAAQKKQYDAQVALNEKAKQDVADKKATEKDNSSLAQGWAKSAFDSQQPQLASQLSALDPASPTFKQDLATLQAKINPNNSLDSQYKQMQIKELAQKIKDANNPNGGLGGLNGLITPVAQLPDGTYDTATQDALLAQMSPADAALVKAVGSYTMDIAKVTSLRSDQRQILATKVALVYPGFDMTNYSTHAKYRASLAGTTQGTTGGAINSANKVINHLTSYISNVNNLSNTAIGSGIGQFINSVKTNVQSIYLPSLQKQKAEAQTDAVGVKDELAKFFKGSGVADVTSIADWAKTVNVDASPAAQQGAVQGAIELLQGQLVPMIDQYKQVMGTEPPAGLFLKTDTLQNLSSLKNQGYKIDIPGVYYTDKSAWLKYGGGTQDSWNTAIYNLTTAGLPLTNENILQASQLY